MSIKPPMRNVVSATHWLQPTMDDALLLHLQCGHKQRFTTRRYRSRVVKKVPKRTQCFDCQREGKSHDAK